MSLMGRLFSFRNNPLLGIVRRNITVETLTEDSKQGLEEKLKLACKLFIEEALCFVAKDLVVLTLKIESEIRDALGIEDENGSKSAKTAGAEIEAHDADRRTHVVGEISRVSETFATRLRSVCEKVHLYIDDKETETTLLGPVRDRISESCALLRRNLSSNLGYSNAEVDTIRTALGIISGSTERDAIASETSVVPERSRTVIGRP